MKIYNTISDIIVDFNKLNEKDRFLECTYKLTKIEKRIYNFEEKMLNNWENISSIFYFNDKFDYFNYIISTPKYAKMMNTKNILETYLSENPFFADYSFESDSDSDSEVS